MTETATPATSMTPTMAGGLAYFAIAALDQAGIKPFH